VWVAVRHGKSERLSGLREGQERRREAAKEKVRLWEAMGLERELGLDVCSLGYITRTCLGDLWHVLCQTPTKIYDAVVHQTLIDLAFFPTSFEQHVLVDIGVHPYSEQYLKLSLV
jgi:hypothetical protein